jgi:hypothetical protein
MAKYALKEWSAVWEALATGRQSILLRKGGLAEAGEEFDVPASQFWLFPTYTHQQESALKHDAAIFLEKARAARPAQNRVRLTHSAELAGVYHVHELLSAILLSHWHILSDHTVEERFAYQRPGIYVLVLRVYRAPQIHELIDMPSYAGCRSWVELDQDLPTEGGIPVLSDGEFSHLMRTLDRLLRPVGLA